MRGFARGSDGLAEIIDPDLLNVILPRIKEGEERDRLDKQVRSLMTGEARFSKAVSAVMEDLAKYPVPPSRKSHCSLV